MKELFRDKQYGIGLILVSVSFLIYLLGLNVKEEGEALGIFFVHFIFTAGYWLSVIISAIFFRKKYRFCRVFPALVLSLISAYALNRCMNIFDASPFWFSIVLATISAACLSLAFFKEMPRPLRLAVSAIVGAGMIVFLYLAVYLVPIYPISMAIFWVLGISLHGFVPLLFIVFISVWLYKFGTYDKKALLSTAAGAGFVIVSATVFTVRWAHTVNLINDTYRETFVEDDAAFPAWVRVAQRIPKNNVTNKALKVGLTYLLPDFDSNNFFNFNFPSRFTEPKIHDPFIVTACFFTDEPCLNDEEKIKILESIYDCRQQATERLWSDEGIETTYVNSSVLIWPQYRTAYTEQVIMVRNTKSLWRGGEAVYTFHLPEGSVVTSLSLWINGKEEKGILTSKSKADSAYRTIVGVESRDPSLVHWQEGSTVNVRVFPVTDKEERTFKIGITSPLKKTDRRLIYEPVYFEGTDFTKAKEVAKISFMQTPENPKYPSFFKKEGSELSSKKKTKYDNRWTVSMDDTGLSAEPFCFDNRCYTVRETKSREIPVDIRDVYLDVNRSWSKAEFDEVTDIFKNKKILMYDGQEMKSVTAENKDHLYRTLKNQEFSLFPVHLIERPEQSLLVGKSTAVSPNLSDLKDSRFFESLKRKARSDRAVYFFDLGEELSPYLKTLREYRLLHYRRGDVAELRRMAGKSVFVQTSPEDDSCVTVHDAEIDIVKQSDNIRSSVAPDHLMRLFAYNHIMFRYAESWNTASPVTDALVSEAQQAYVVSPVSSLVVLESQADYDRFDIKDTENSLHNASKSSKGAVPEPHEWALMAIAGFIAVYLYVRRRTTKCSVNSER